MYGHMINQLNLNCDFFLYFIVMFLYVLKNVFSADALLVIITIFYIFFLHASALEKREFRKLIQYQFIIKKMRFETVDLSIFS